jgi:hypothetical protein
MVRSQLNEAALWIAIDLEGGSVAP